MKVGSIFLILFAIFSQTIYAQKTLSVGYEYMPGFSYVSESGQYLGVDFEILTASATAAGLKLEFHDIPWKRILVSIENGTLDLTTAASQTSKREKYAYFSNPYREEYYSLFVSSKKPEHIGIREFKEIFNKDFKLGIVIGVWYGAEFSDYMKNPDYKHKTNKVVTDLQNIRMLSKGRINGFLCEPILAKGEIKKQGLSHQIIESNFRYSNGYVHFMFSKASVPQQIVKDFNKGLKIIIENGTYDKIISAYY